MRSYQTRKFRVIPPVAAKVMVTLRSGEEIQVVMGPTGDRCGDLGDKSCCDRPFRHRGDHVAVDWKEIGPDDVDTTVMVVIDRWSRGTKK